MFIRHTCYLLSSLLSIFTGKMFCTALLFCKFSYLDQFYSFTLAILLYDFLTECLPVTRANFLRFFLCIFIEKIFLHKFYRFIFCKFSLDQFHSFTCAIDLYRFYHNVYPPHVPFFNFLPLVILKKKFFCTVLLFANLVI